MDEGLPGGLALVMRLNSVSRSRRSVFVLVLHLGLEQIFGQTLQTNIAYMTNHKVDAYRCL